MTRRQIRLIVYLAILIPIAAVVYHQILPSSTESFTANLVNRLFPSEATDMTSQASRPCVIVVGGGLAGLSAAYSALHAGAPSVRLLERAPKPGGNSIKASSGINGANTRFQQAAWPDLGPDETFWDDTVRSAGIRLASQTTSQPAARAQRESLISVLTERSADAINFLTDLGVDLTVVAQLGGHSHPRTHRGAGKTPPGAAIISTLVGKLKEAGEDGRFELMTDCEVTRLLTDPTTTVSSSSNGNGGSSVDHRHHQPAAVTGVEYRSTKKDGGDGGTGDGDGNVNQLTGPVIFTTGGFGGDTHGLLARYRPDLSGMPSTNDPRPGTHDLLAAVGARLVDMDSVQIHPTGFVDPANPLVSVKFLAAEMLRGEGGILLHNGKRFVNELETRERVSNTIMALPGDGVEDSPLRQWDIQLLLDPGAAEAAAGHMGFYLWKGLMKKLKVSDLDATTKETLKDHASIVKGEKEDPFRRKAFGHWKLGVNSDGTIDEDAEVCVGRVTPIVHFTMGGAVFNEHAQVLSSELGQEQKPIQGLWAAGEITGGIHGDNRLGGSSLLECVVFGRIAGAEAAESVKGANN
ncbi:FAD binding domain-containing protein [Sordaria brevicollis]|uniref:Fumarate reductase n=1 Tax=Sordaria brevicollis TaxID=83679 RepID=A0AAE0P197_SORBR|nr:FAD binding domain-containing protein [Sordaria brevicollis]